MYTAMYMSSSTRTQIYLTPALRRLLDETMRREHKTMAQVIREALDVYLVKPEVSPEEALEETFGSMPDVRVPPREEWDRV